MDSESDEAEPDNEADDHSNSSNHEHNEISGSENEPEDFMIDAVIARKEAYICHDEVRGHAQDVVNVSFSQVNDAEYGTSSGSQSGFFSQLLERMLQKK